MSVLEASGLFDPEYYRRRYVDVAARGVDPLRHYVRNGSREGRQPNALFQPQYYQKGLNALGLAASSPNLLLTFIQQKEPKPSPCSYFPNGLTPEQLRARLSALQAHSPPEGFSDLRLPNHVTILVPIFNGGVDIIADCLTSLSRHCSEDWCDIVLMDDASTDPEVIALLTEFSRRPSVVLKRRASNLGFTKNVNLGLREAKNDVVLLNSDTRVTAGAVRQLAFAAYQRESIATATALSNNSGAFSTPRPQRNETPSLVPLDVSSRLSRRCASSPISDVPTGNGFAMYIKYAALVDVGGFNEEAFPSGYGEENEWCMRASEKGWRHVIALRSYVEHANARSFGSERKKELIAQGRAQLDKIHPDYKNRISAFAKNKELAHQRTAFERELGEMKSGLPRILYVVSSTTGGTPQTNGDLMRGVSGFYDPYLLTCDARELKLFDCSEGRQRLVALYVLAETLTFLHHRSSEYDDVLGSWLYHFDIELVHVRHIGWHSLGLLEVAKRQGIPVVFSFHDFYCACPSVTMTAAGVPWQRGGISQPHVFSPLWKRRDPEGVASAEKMHGGNFLAMWRRRMEAALEHATAYVTTTESTKMILQENLPLLEARSREFHVIPHGRNFESLEDAARFPSTSQKCRVLIPGNINEAKGAYVLDSLLKLPGSENLEFHLLGDCITLLKDNRKIVHHGRYERDEFASLVRNIAPCVALIGSIWPETFCHTLTECWAAGIPVVGSNLGAVGERLVSSNAGWSVDASSPEAVLEILTRIAKDRTFWERGRDAVLRWQQSTEAQRGVAEMAQEYLRLYSGVLRPQHHMFRAGVTVSPRTRMGFVGSHDSYQARYECCSLARDLLLREARGPILTAESAEEYLRTAERDYDVVLVVPSFTELDDVMARSLKDSRKRHFVVFFSPKREYLEAALKMPLVATAARVLICGSSVGMDQDLSAIRVADCEALLRAVGSENELLS